MKILSFRHFKCDSCGKEFEQNITLIRHVKVVHEMSRLLNVILVTKVLAKKETWTYM